MISLICILVRTAPIGGIDETLSPNPGTIKALGLTSDLSRYSRLALLFEASSKRGGPTFFNSFLANL